MMPFILQCLIAFFGAVAIFVALYLVFLFGLKVMFWLVNRWDKK